MTIRALVLEIISSWGEIFSDTVSIDLRHRLPCGSPHRGRIIPGIEVDNESTARCTGRNHVIANLAQRGVAISLFNAQPTIEIATVASLLRNDIIRVLVRKRPDCGQSLPVILY